MKIHLYKTTSANNVVTKELTDEFVLEGALRDGEFTILRPTITVQRNVSEYNFAWVPDFKRYYFIDNVRVLREKLFAIYMRVDVLMTYGAQIRLLTGETDEMEGGNPYLSSQLDVEVRKDIERVSFENNFTTGDYIIIAVRAGEDSGNTGPNN